MDAAVDAEVERRQSEQNAKEQGNVADINKQYGETSDEPLLNNSNKPEGITTEAPVTVPADNEADN